MKDDLGRNPTSQTAQRDNIPKRTNDRFIQPPLFLLTQRLLRREQQTPEPQAFEIKRFTVKLQKFCNLERKLLTEIRFPFTLALPQLFSAPSESSLSVKGRACNTTKTI